MATTIGTDNPQVPGIQSEIYVPDQLIAGRFPLVTGQNITLTGSRLLSRGAVLGQITQGTVASAAGTQATGTITFTAQPAVNDTLTLNGTAITFIANGSTPSGNQVAIGATLDATVTALLAFLRASADTQIVKNTYSASGDVITLTAVLGGTAANSFTLAKSSAGITLSGANMSGGAANTGNPTFGTITRGAKFNANGSYIVTMTAATVFTLVDPNGDVLTTTGATGVAFTDPQISFTLTAGGTPAVAGDRFVITPAAGSGKYTLCNQAATDGSQVPVAILADTTDATGGDVLCGAYFTGEFNQNALQYDPSWTLAQLTTALRPLSIFLRSVVSAATPS